MVSKSMSSMCFIGYEGSGVEWRGGKDNKKSGKHICILRRTGK